MIDSRCQERGCKSRDAHPQFTAPLKSIGPHKDSRQPKWFCAEHAKKHPRVSPITGQALETMVKSYQMNGHGLRPLPRMEQYEIVRREVKDGTRR